MASKQEESRQFELGMAGTQLGVRVKLPKAVLGFLELGLSATYSLEDLDDGDKKLPAASLLRFKPTLTIKDILLRGKLELDPSGRKLHYSKKLRLPLANTELLKLRLTASWPAPEAASGLLGRGLGLTLSFAPPERLHAAALVRAPPHYSAALAPRVGPPQALFDKLGFPGSVYVKPRATLHLTDSASAAGLRARLEVHRLTAVVRLYDPDRVKPCRLGRNLAAAARRLTLEDLDAEEQEAGQAGQVCRGRAAPAKATRAPEAAPEYPEVDVIDRAAAKAREWAHAVLVNGCVATAALQEQAEAAGQRLRELFSARMGKLGASS